MTSRREFLEAVSAASLFALYPESTVRRLEECSRRAPEQIRPPPLERDMTVGLVAPSSQFFEPVRYRQAEEMVRSLGFRPFLAPHARDCRGYLAGRDQDRAADLNAMFADDQVGAIWCLRGGYGALRLLPLLDYESFARRPKVFIGYSDVTAIHLAIQKLTGVVTFHGPMLGSNLSAYALAELEKVVSQRRPAGRIGAPPPFAGGPGQVDRGNPVSGLHSGQARGRLVGGNLTLLCRLLGTPFEPDLNGRILFLEDVGEATYRIDGLLTHLRLSGKLGACAGIAFGRFTEDGGSGGEPGRLPTETVLQELTSDLGLPVFSGLMCGHLADQTTLPYGVLAELDADNGTLTLLEPAVS